MRPQPQPQSSTASNVSTFRFVIAATVSAGIENRSACMRCVSISCASTGWNVPAPTWSVTNAVAIHLYESIGFVTTGVRRGYYTDNREDALIMWREPESTEQAS